MSDMDMSRRGLLKTSLFGAAAAGMGLAASSIAGSAQTMAKAATGMAGLMSAAKEAKSGLVAERVNAFNNRENKGGPLSAADLMNVKPPSAVSVARSMAGTAGKAAWDKAVKNSAGGKLAQKIAADNKKNNS